MGEVPGRGRVQGLEQLGEKRCLGRLGRHEHDDDGHQLDAGRIVEARHRLALELADQHGLAHPALAGQQDVLHPLPPRLRARLLQVAKNAFSRGVLHPALGADVHDPRLRIERCDRPHILRQVRKLASCGHHQNSTPLVSPFRGIGTRASGSGARSASGCGGAVVCCYAMPVRATARRAALLRSCAPASTWRCSSMVAKIACSSTVRRPCGSAVGLDADQHYIALKNRSFSGSRARAGLQGCERRPEWVRPGVCSRRSNGRVERVRPCLPHNTEANDDSSSRVLSRSRRTRNRSSCRFTVTSRRRPKAE